MHILKHNEKKIYVKIALFTTIFLIGCSGTTQLPVIPTKPIVEYSLSQQNQGLTISIDPFLEKERVEYMFGTDLLSKNILPVLVVVENKSSNSNFYLQKELSSLERGKTTSPLKQPSKQMGKRVIIGTLGVGSVFSPAAVVGLAVFVPLVDRSNTKAQTIKRNLIEKELKEKTLAPKEIQRGFIYFELPEETPIKDISSVQLKALNLEKDENVVFDFQINGE